MQGIFHHVGRSRLAVLVLAGGLTAACSTYHPLDGGSDVPWAQATSRQDGTATARVSGRATQGLAPGQYRVQAGDRLSQLALRYGVTVQALAEANRLEAPYVIYTGQALQIPGLTQVEAAPPMAIIGDRYVVRRGDTLSGIASRIDVPLVQLAAANQLASPYPVYAGQKLRIPGADEVVAEPLVVEPPAPKIALAPVARGKAPPLSGQGYLWPVNGKVVGGFGPLGQGQRRDGIDIAARAGAPVLAAEDGIVAYAGEGIRTLGRLILIRHDEGYITTYAHNAALLVDTGTPVERGQVIARVGSTGDVARPLLHFELRRGRQPLDPETVLVREPTALASTQ
jgi:murein DD-endopeptidase MepM/ murein hydrolase activator NlpD